MEILQIKNLSFSYPNQTNKAIDNISLSINEGDFAVICGESGCGKSTLLRLIKKEIAPFGKLNGSIQYNGKKIEEIDKKTSAKDIGFVLQNPDTQIVTDRVWHELAFGLESLGYDTDTIKRKVAEMASYFGITDWYNKKTTELSGGQKQLLNLASVMVMNPKLILLDEPTAQLDPIAASNFINTLHKINKDLGITVLLVEHRLEEIFPIADKVILLSGGKLLYNSKPQGIVDYLRQNPKEHIVKALPTATRIFEKLNGVGDAPLTVRDCRNYITSNYKNDIKKLEIAKYEHSSVEKIKLKNVYFRYERDLPDVLTDVSFSVYEGEHFCILGGNGTGKSTTLSVIAGLLKAYRGKIYIDGKKMTSLSQKDLYQNNIALLPQNPQALFIEDNVYDDLNEICKNRNIEKSKAKEQIEKICQSLSISRLLNMHPYDLSGGEMQKVALAKLLLLEPKILLLDEPTKGIDAYAKDELGEILDNLAKSGVTIITVTHDIEFAAQYASQCGLFFNGELIAVSTPYEFFSGNSFYTTSANKITRDYFDNAIMCDDVVKLCNSNKGVTKNE